MTRILLAWYAPSTQWPKDHPAFKLHNKTAEVRVAAWLRRPVVRALPRVSCVCVSQSCVPPPLPTLLRTLQGPGAQVVDCKTKFQLVWSSYPGPAGVTDGPSWLNFMGRW